MIKNTAQTYGSVSKILHWTMAVMVIGLLAMGLFMTELPAGDSKWFVYDIHKSFGMLVFALALFRVLWRYFSVTPALPASMPAWQQKLARITHYALIAFLILFPLSGLIMSVFAGYPVKVFGLFEIPALTTGQTPIAGVAHGFHVNMPYVVIALVVIHFFAALYHHFFIKDDVLRRMI